MNENQCSSKQTCPSGSSRCKYGRNSGMCSFVLSPTLSCDDNSICEVGKPVLYNCFVSIILAVLMVSVLVM